MAVGQLAEQRLLVYHALLRLSLDGLCDARSHLGQMAVAALKVGVELEVAPRDVGVGRVASAQHVEREVARRQRLVLLVEQQVAHQSLHHQFVFLVCEDLEVGAGRERQRLLRQPQLVEIRRCHQALHASLHGLAPHAAVDREVASEQAHQRRVAPFGEQQPVYRSPHAMCASEVGPHADVRLRLQVIRLVHQSEPLEVRLLQLSFQLRLQLVALHLRHHVKRTVEQFVGRVLLPACQPQVGDGSLDVVGILQVGPHLHVRVAREHKRIVLHAQARQVRVRYLSAEMAVDALPIDASAESELASHHRVPTVHLGRHPPFVQLQVRPDAVERVVAVAHLPYVRPDDRRRSRAEHVRAPSFRRQVARQHAQPHRREEVVQVEAPGLQAGVVALRGRLVIPVDMDPSAPLRHDQVGLVGRGTDPQRPVEADAPWQTHHLRHLPWQEVVGEVQVLRPSLQPQVSPQPTGHREVLHPSRRRQVEMAVHVEVDVL